MNELIEKTIEAVGIPPAMRERARENLKRKTEAEIRAIHDKAVARKEHAKEFLSHVDRKIK